MDSFKKVGINNFGENFVALFDAQELTNTKAEAFRVLCDGRVFEGLISSVHVTNKYFRIQMPDGTETERLDIDKLEKIERLADET